MFLNRNLFSARGTSAVIPLLHHCLPTKSVDAVSSFD